MSNPEDAHVVAIDALPGSARGRQFDGAEHGARISFILALNPPGSGPALHRHPYEETFILEQGTVRFTVGDDQLEAHAGDVVVVPAGVPHAFVNVGPEPMRSISLHPCGADADGVARLMGRPRTRQRPIRACFRDRRCESSAASTGDAGFRASRGGPGEIDAGPPVRR